MSTVFGRDILAWGLLTETYQRFCPEKSSSLAEIFLGHMIGLDFYRTFKMSSSAKISKQPKWYVCYERLYLEGVHANVYMYENTGWTCMDRAIN